MNKVLLATTALALTGGAAFAEVELSGSGRFGVIYVESDDNTVNETTINTRLRFNIDASTETTSGITFGGRIRLQYDNGDVASAGSLDLNDPATPLDSSDDTEFGTGAGAELSAAKLYGSMNGMTVEVGNVDTAYDSAALMYNSEIGFIGRSFGNPQGSYYSFDSSPFGIDEADRMGLAFTYGVENFNVRLSYVTPDQINDLGAGVNEEISVSADYTFDQFTVSGAAVMDGLGIDGNDQFFVGAQYALSDIANVGVLYFDNGDVGGVEVGNGVTLYGNYGMGATTLRGYVAHNDNDFNEDNLAFGLGADYDLGGATLAGMVARGFNSDVTADLGVKFNF